MFALGEKVRKYMNRVICTYRYAGQVGYMYSGMKSTEEAQVGDTFFAHGKPVEALPGFKPARPMVRSILEASYGVDMETHFCFCTVFSFVYRL